MGFLLGIAIGLWLGSFLTFLRFNYKIVEAEDKENRATQHLDNAKLRLRESLNVMEQGQRESKKNMRRFSQTCCSIMDEMEHVTGKDYPPIKEVRAYIEGKMKELEVG